MTERKERSGEGGGGGGKGGEGKGRDRPDTAYKKNVYAITH